MLMKALPISIVLFFSIFTSLYAQDRSDYSYTDVSGYYCYPVEEGQVVSGSSTYWFGGTWFFFWSEVEHLMNQNHLILNCGRTEIYSDGNFKESNYCELNEKFSVEEVEFEPHVSSCVLSNDLFFCYYFYDIYSEKSKLRYGKKKPDGSGFNLNTIDFDFEVKKQMAVVGINDTLYLFFVDNADKKVKLLRGAVDDYYTPNLTWIDSSPIVITDTHLSVGNVSACHFSKLDHDDRIMLAFPTESSGKSNNEFFIYEGIDDNFQLYGTKNVVNNRYANSVAIEQGSVKGGTTGGYMFQLAYSYYGDYGQHAYRCEFEYHDKNFGDWEDLTFYNGELNYSDFVGFATGYTKGANSRHKFLYQMYIGEWIHAINCFSWESDKLLHSATDDRDGTPAIHLADDYYDLILVVEGAPPYALNGNALSSCTPSTITIGTETDKTVSVSTTFKQSVEASIGYGSVTAGFSASFQESSGTSNTETEAFSYPLSPPEVDSDSAGFMWYFCMAPHINRERWRLYDYDGNEIEPKRSLFFFDFIGLTPKWLKKSLSYYDHSPQPYKLSSYVDRNVEDFTFVENSGDYDAQIDVDGLTTHIDLSWSKNKTNEFDQDYEINLSVDANVLDIFDVSAGISAGVEVDKTTTTNCTKSLSLDWAPPAPVWDTSHTDYINNYSVTNYIMLTLDSTAYFLDEHWKRKYRPYFVTYEVYDINDPDISGINTDKESIFKFKNYPNPCSDITWFTYTLSEKSEVDLRIYDQTGRLMISKHMGIQGYGDHKLEVNTTGVRNGLYTYQLMINGYSITGKLVIN